LAPVSVVDKYQEGNRKMLKHQGYPKGGIFCRIYSEDIVLRGQSEQFEGTACRDNDGIWQPI
jgi:surface antigen